MLSKIMSSLARILLNQPLIGQTSQKTNEQERKERKEKGEKKNEHSYVLISLTLEKKEEVTH